MMNFCRTIKIEPPDFGEAVYINEKTVEVQTDHSHPINCQVWCPSCCTSDVAIPEYPDMEVPIMKTVATQTDHTHSEGWIVQCTICSSSAVPNAPVQDDWCIKLETPYHSELPQCQSSTGTLTNGIDSRVQDMCVETNHPYAESVQRSFDAAVYRMERSDTEMRRRNMGLGPGEQLRRQFSPDHGMARSVEVSETAEMSRNFLIPGNVVTTHVENMSRGIPVSRMDDMSCGFNTPRNGDILHVNETSSNFGGAGDADSPRRVVLPPNVVEVNALGYEVKRRSPENKTIPVSGTYNHVMENGDLLENHQDVSYDNPLDSLQNGVEEEKDKAIKKVRRGPRKGAKKTKSMKASKGTNASEAQKRNWKNVYQCPYCDMSFGWLSHITRHVRSHTGEKPFKCSHCTKRFARTDELQLHLRVHTGERPYECQYCGKKFTQSANLTVHIRIHTGKKPYKCDICKKRFVHSGDYRRHLRVHTREKPYECCYCFKAFADSSDLKVHIRIHTGEMPYQCPLCFKRFRTSGNLNVHVRGGSCQKTKEALKGKKITQLKKTSADLPIMTSTPVPMMAEMPNVVQPAEGLSNLQETQ